jgi:hypothetical protein
MPFLNTNPQDFYIFDMFEWNETESRADPEEKVKKLNNTGT